MFDVIVWRRWVARFVVGVGLCAAVMFVWLEMDAYGTRVAIWLLLGLLLGYGAGLLAAGHLDRVRRADRAREGRVWTRPWKEEP